MVTVSGDMSTSTNYSPSSAEEHRKEQLLFETGTAFYAILWPPIEPHFETIESEIRSRFNVIESWDYVFEDDIGEFVRSVYSHDGRSDRWFIENKIKEFGQQQAVTRILSFEIPNPYFIRDNGEYVSHATLNEKLRLRKFLEDEIESYTYGTGIHMTDNFENNAHISEQISTIFSKRTDI